MTQQVSDSQVTTVRSDALERAMVASDARERGATCREAAEIAGFSDPANCIRAVRRARGHVPTVALDEVREVWRERIEDLWIEAMEDVRQRRPGAVRAAVAVAQRAAALNGLDAPAVTAVITPTEQEKIDWVNGMIVAMGGTAAEEADLDDVMGY